MADFKRKPMPDELTAALRAGVQGVPSAVAEQPPANRGGEVGRPKAPKTVQINFNGTEELARLIAKLAQEAGSTRRLIARLLKDAGHTVPDADLNPSDNRRRWSE
jgi:hypothetical protein